MMKQRNHAFDFLCGICIIRMIMLHITNACGFGDDDWWQTIMHWTYYFMGFFFFKAGYFNKTVSGNSLQYVADRARRLLVPYVVWGLVGATVYMFFCTFIFVDENPFVKDIRVAHLWETSQWYGNVPMWFLFSFFMCYIAVHFIEKLRIYMTRSLSEFSPLMAKAYSWIINVMYIALPFVSYWMYLHDNPLPYGLDNVFLGIFLFFLGRMWHLLTGRLKRAHTVMISVAMLLAFAVLNSVSEGIFIMSDNYWECESIVCTLLSTVLALCGISGLLLTLDMPRVPVINYIGQHSMVYFVAHYPLLMFFKLTHSACGRSLRGHWDDYVILILLLFAFCSWIVPYVERKHSDRA